MRSEESPEYGTQSVIKKWFNRQQAADYKPASLSFLAVEKLQQARLARFTEEHRDLDVAIALLSVNRISDDQLITRLKKRRLHLKDEIALIEAST
jgi:uncharacterized protein YdcH (DUF465 family)